MRTGEGEIVQHDRPGTTTVGSSEERAGSFLQTQREYGDTRKASAESAPFAGRGGAVAEENADVRCSVKSVGQIGINEHVVDGNIWKIRNGGSRAGRC